MNSEEISTIAVNPFIRKFVFAIIQSIQAKNISHEEKYVIHADLVPKISKKVIQASLGERVGIRPRNEKVETGGNINYPIIAIKKRNMSNLTAPIIRPKITRAPVSPPTFIQQVPSRVQAPQITPPVQPIIPQGAHIGLSQDYGKITPLLNDPSVSTIECHGKEKPIMIIRTGQKQITRIVLSEQDIKNILEKISDTVRIPLLEGVFRAAVDNFLINAIISQMIGSRFIIKKQTAYAMLEKKS